MTSTERTNFRKRKTWIDFRSTFKKEKDALTGSKLSKRFNLHHMDLNPNHYDNLSIRENFIPLNSKSHDVIHFLLPYYKKDPMILNRLQSILDKMVQLEGPTTETLFKEIPERKDFQIEKRNYAHH